MYLDYYNIREEPFRLTPDPDFLFKSDSYLRAIHQLRDGIKTGKGFILVVGEVGTGKTILCRSLFKDLSHDKNIEVAVIFNSFLSPFELLKHINEDFLLPAKGNTTEELIRELTDFLIKCKEESKKVVVVIDESQNLSFNALEQIRMLSNLETTKEKLIQIVLVGQPELHERLNSYELRQLNQRITIRCNIKPLAKSEIAKYLDFRLKVAGAQNSKLFADETLNRIYSFSKGTPRIINVLCENALKLGAVSKINIINKAILNKAISRIKKIDIPKHRFSKWERKFMPAVMLVLLSIFALSMGRVYLSMKGYQKELKYQKEKDVISVLEKYEEVIKTPVSAPKKFVYKNLEDQKVSQVVFASLEILKMWKSEANLLEELWILYQNREDVRFDTIARNTGFDVWTLQISSKMIPVLNMPMIFKLFEEGNKINYAVLVGINENGVVIQKAHEQPMSYSYKEFRKIWFGEVIVFCRNFPMMESILFRGKYCSKKEMHMLQTLLIQAGFLDREYIDISRKIDAEVEESIKKVQHKYKLKEDGLVTKEMKVLLYRLANGDDVPYITEA